jgi:adenylate cyclase
VQANSRFQPPYFYQAAALALAGRLEEAQPLARRVLEIEPSFRISGFYEFGMVRAIADKVAEGARLLGLPE